ncbi:hypothetical protein D3C72_1282710 [compost metagenome]
MDLGRSLPDQKQTTGNQDHVLPGEGLAQDLDHRCGQLHDEGDGAQQCQTQDQRHADTDTACFLLVLLGQFVGQDRDKDQVIDAEHDFHHHQCGQSNPSGGAGGEL